MPTKLECDRCGRYFMTEQAMTLLVALTGSCACGGRFGLSGGGEGRPAGAADADRA